MDFRRRWTLEVLLEGLWERREEEGRQEEVERGRRKEEDVERLDIAERVAPSG